jgi:hypothetical protein
VEQHQHQEYATHQDLNGFGKRVNGVEGDTRENTVRSERNESDIQDLFRLATENTRGIYAIKESLAHLVGKVSGAVAVITGVVIVIAEIVKHYLTKGAP